VNTRAIVQLGLGQLKDPTAAKFVVKNRISPILFSKYIEPSASNFWNVTSKIISG
jgi:hypothetical protein